MSSAFGIPFEPREWFIVPLAVIYEVMKRIQDETIVDFVYDTKLGKFEKSDC